MRQMKVLGIELRDYTVRESMRIIDTFLKGGRVNTIAFITMHGLMVAENDERLQDFLSKMDMTISADSDILRAAGLENRNRLREIDQGEFMEEFLKKLVRVRKSVYLLTNTKEQMELLLRGLKSYEETLNIVGYHCLDELSQDDEYLVNEINVKMADVIISNLSSPRRESFYEENHMKLNACIWMMLKDEVIHPSQKRGITKKLYAMAMSKLFRRKVTQYQNTEKEDKNEAIDKIEKNETEK